MRKSFSKRQTQNKRQIQNKIENILLFSPGFIIYVGIVILSIFICFYYSFFDWNGVAKTMNFVGFTNYIKALKQGDLLNSIGNTFFFTIPGTIFVTMISMVLAVFLNRKSRLTSFYRSAFFFPQLISPIAVGFIFKALLSYIGIINNFFENIGIEKIDFLGTIEWAKWSVLFVLMWSAIGFATVIYLSGLQAIPKEMYEAADIDGASFWNKFTHVTFPWLAPSFTTVTVFLFTGFLKTFDRVYVLTGGGPADSTETIATSIIKIGFNQFRLSYASAISIYFLIIVSVLSVSLMTFLRKREEALIG